MYIVVLVHRGSPEEPREQIVSGKPLLCIAPAPTSQSPIIEEWRYRDRVCTPPRTRLQVLAGDPFKARMQSPLRRLEAETTAGTCDPRWRPGSAQLPTVGNIIIMPVKRASIFSFQSKGGGVIILEEDGPPASQVRARTVSYHQGIFSGTTFNYTSGGALTSGRYAPLRTDMAQENGTASSISVGREPRDPAINYHPIRIGLACNFSFLELIEKIFDRIKGLLRN
ncbi:hypothetical protein DFP72DRAFT_844939 [Ephemerocybe angulata]|uniref:Uncharacterized protein n=1 Tax=Ephemerocybe angulata TaxID=980116 RepID=A0A8H6MB06_9AGAR|nr:hypothetical protein DFP72DRAFT_844939 [Tulosesus angulatus]